MLLNNGLVHIRRGDDSNLRGIGQPQKWIKAAPRIII